MMFNNQVEKLSDEGPGWGKETLKADEEMKDPIAGIWMSPNKLWLA